MAYELLVFKKHALMRMHQRSVTAQDVRNILATGEVIEEYPKDQPYPSRLVAGFAGVRPIHVVAADNNEDEETIIITVYEPVTDLWDPTFRRRKTP